ncbi:MAG: response regulator, partial [Crocinitomicaceae bacterium]|nr:response regulator [Crocinitomicaceae bacterium]
VKHLLLENNYKNIHLFHSGEECLRKLDQSPDLIILDHDLGQMSGLDVLKKIKNYDPNIKVIFLSGQEKEKVAVSALKHGAFDYLEKHTDSLERLILIINRIVYSNALVQENKKLKIFKTGFYLVSIFSLSVLIYLWINNSISDN